MTAADQYLDTIQARVDAEHGSSADPCGSKVCVAQRDRAKLLNAVKAVERECKYLDTLAPGDKHYAGVFRKAITEALGGTV